ncbi:prefoldin subunit 4 [Venturia nashicola]|uniref:Prefoldin subunit 4 n=1 Tax=Venturia nashicola TaxID=86259 RepID=A0A4Z1NPV4_9PEZI|nr:prefoldin subunit 4 [Venturia nashicola]TLD27698.1 prefoldin subunit 4 [Venturia nashicola]
MQRRMLTKEEEAGAEDIEVRREDQEKINKFSRLHQRESTLEEQLRQKQKDKEDLEEINTELEELELMDEDSKIPYKIGDSFFTLPLPEVQELVSGSTTKIEEDVSKLEEKISGIREEMSELKVALYARFGRSINLET